jgi:hypothetical protein
MMVSRQRRHPSRSPPDRVQGRFVGWSSRTLLPLAGGCACTASGQAAAVPPTSPINSRRRIRFPSSDDSIASAETGSLRTAFANHRPLQHMHNAKLASKSACTDTTWRSTRDVEEQEPIRMSGDTSKTSPRGKPSILADCGSAETRSRLLPLNTIPSPSISTRRPHGTQCSRGW